MEVECTKSYLDLPETARELFIADYASGEFFRTGVVSCYYEPDVPSTNTTIGFPSYCVAQSNSTSMTVRVYPMSLQHLVSGIVRLNIYNYMLEITYNLNSLTSLPAMYKRSIESHKLRIYYR